MRVLTRCEAEQRLSRIHGFSMEITHPAFKAGLSRIQSRFTSSASQEQANGVAQVGEAVTQMDHATQQNAALVEEMAAAANSLNLQGQELVRAVSLFRWEDSAASDAVQGRSSGAAHREALQWA